MSDLIYIDPTTVPTRQKEQIAMARIADRRWRLQNLYKIKDKYGNVVDFDPNWAQLMLLKPHNLNLILKARQLGITTFFSILFLDTCLFNDHIQAAIIADAKPIAREIFVDKVKFAYDNLPDWVKQMTSAYRDNVNELRFSNGSAFRVGTSVRGNTLQLLHITEFAKTCVENPRKADEIMTGALNTLQAGQFACIESTARGKDGHFYEMCMNAIKLEKSGRALTAMDWKFWFFPWYQEQSYSLPNADIPISKELQMYFQSLEKDHGILLDLGQRNWYAKKHETQGDDMKREFPSTPEESFESANEGFYFAKLIARARHERRVCHIPPDPHVLKFSAWDIGWSDSTAIWTFQVVGKEIHFLDCYENSGESLEHYVKWLKTRPYDITKHFLPHDSAGRSAATGKAYVDYAREMGLKCEVLKIEHNKLVDIEMVRYMLNRCWFNTEGTERGLKCLENYRKEWNDKLECYRERPLHNWASHCFTGDTKVLTRHGTYQIMDMPYEGEILTLSGWRKYKCPRITRKNASLVEVKFKDGTRVRCTPDHLFLTVGGWKSAKCLSAGLEIQSFWTKSLNTTMGDFTEYFQGSLTSLEAVNTCIEKFGKKLLAIFQKIATFITKTGTQRTTRYTILNALTVKNTQASAAKKEILTYGSLKMPEKKRVFGTGHQKEDFGISGMRKDLNLGQNGKGNRSRVLFAGWNTTALLEQTDTSKNIVAQNADRLVIEGVKNLNEKEDVWCISVPEEEHFSLANGAIVHNCTDAFIYAINGVQKITGNSGLTPEQWKEIRSKYV